MSPEEKQLLKEAHELVKENNEMLRSMRRSMRIQGIMSIVYWVFIIGSAVGAYIIIQPYLEQVMGVYSSAGDVFNSFK